MRLLLIAFLNLIFSIACLGQDAARRRTAAFEQLFMGSHFGISIIPQLTERSDTRWQEGPFHLGSHPDKGVELGFDYQVHFDRYYSVSAGLHGTAAVRNFSFRVPREAFTPVESEDFEETGATGTADMYLSFPLRVERRWFSRSGDFWNVFAGVRVGFYPDEFSEGSSYSLKNAGGQYYNAFVLDLEVGHNWKPWLDYTAGGGYSWVLRNNNLLRLNLVANLSNTHLAKGTYQFNIPGQPVSKGSYASNLSNLGLSIQYAFTGTNRRLVREQRLGD